MVILTFLPPPAEGVRHRQPSTSAFINNRDIGKGTLYIAESHLSWVDGCSGKTFSLEYPHICIHAVSRDQTTEMGDCLYMMVDADIDFAEVFGGSNNGHPRSENEEESEDNDGEDGEPLTEFKFVPEDNTVLDAMFSAMSDCQALHPDSQDSQSDIDEEGGDGDEAGEEDDDEFMDAGDRPHTNGSNQADMEVDVGQFDDAEE